MVLSFPTFETTLPAYAEALPRLVAEPAPFLDGAWDTDGEYARLIARYAVKKRLGFFGKLRFAKACVAAFGKELPIPLKKLRFPLLFRHEIYMTDSGELSVSCGTVQRHNVYRLTALLLHELAHLLLSAEKDYPQLLALDRAFLTKNKENPIAVTLSPVEVYATLLSVLLLEKTADCLNGDPQEKLRAQAESEKEKLRAAYREFLSPQI